MLVEERFAAELAWARGHVTITGEPTARERAWSVVLRLPTADGPVWLKRPAAAQRCELGLYGLLVAHAPDAAVHPIAVDEDRGLLLLPDGGPTVADAPPDALAARLTAALPGYAHLQRALAPQREAMLALGVPDASPGALARRFDEAVAATGLDSDLPRRRVLVVAQAARLAGGPGADLVTVDHQDLHPGNVLDGPRFYDWGDAVVAHPFASLLVIRAGLARTLGLPFDDPVILAARDAYLSVFADLAPHTDLVDTADTACRAALVARALTWHRAVGHDPTSPFADAARVTLAVVGERSPYDGA